jgi:hypothetical protein
MSARQLKTDGEERKVKFDQMGANRHQKMIPLAFTASLNG